MTTRAALIDAAAAHDVQECSEIFANPERGTNRFGLLCSCGWRSDGLQAAIDAANTQLNLAFSEGWRIDHVRAALTGGEKE